MVSITKGVSQVASPPPFDKDIELKKIDLVSEELRTGFFTAIGAYFSVLIGIITAVISFDLTTSLAMVAVTALSFIYLAVLGIVGAVVAVDLFRSIATRREQLRRVDALIEEVERGHAIGSVREALQRIRGHG